MVGFWTTADADQNAAFVAVAAPIKRALVSPGQLPQPSSDVVAAKAETAVAMHASNGSGLTNRRKG